MKLILQTKFPYQRYSLAVLLVICCLSCCVAQLQRSCDVHGTPAGAECDMATGEVTCGDPATQFGPECMTGGGDCSSRDVNNACDPEGTVQVDGELKCTAGASPQCICKAGYSGPRCNLPMLFVTCDATELVISITNYAHDTSLGTQGRSYYLAAAPDAFDFTPNNDCNLIGNTYINVYMDALEYVSPANCDVVPVDEELDDVDYKVVYLYLQHITAYQLQTDQVYKVMCSPTAASVNVHQVSTARDNSDALPTTYSRFGDAEMFLKVPGSGAAPGSLTYNFISGPVALGDDISLILQHTAVFTVKSCQAAPTDAFNTGVIDLIDGDMCIPALTKPLYTDDIAYADNSATGFADEGGSSGNHVIRLPLRAWVWQNNANLYFRCVMCFAQSCSPTTACSPDTTLDDVLFARHGSLDRRRRRSATSLNSTIDLSVSVTVDHPTAGVDVTIGKEGSMSPQSSDVRSCYSSTAVLLPVIMLACLLLVAMVMAFFFCTRMLKDRQLPGGHDNKAYKP